MALKSLTNSKKVINKYGHCCNYIVLEELETEAIFASTSRTLACPVDVQYICTSTQFMHKFGF